MEDPRSPEREGFTLPGEMPINYYLGGGPSVYGGNVGYFIDPLHRGQLIGGFMREPFENQYEGMMVNPYDPGIQWTSPDNPDFRSDIDQSFATGQNLSGWPPEMFDDLARYVEAMQQKIEYDKIRQYVEQRWPMYNRKFYSRWWPTEPAERAAKAVNQ